MENCQWKPLTEKSIWKGGLQKVAQTIVIQSRPTARHVCLGTNHINQLLIKVSMSMSVCVRISFLISANQGGRGVVVTVWREVCGITPFGKPGHRELLKHILDRVLRQIEIYPIPSASNLFNSPKHGAEGVVPVQFQPLCLYFQRQKGSDSREGISKWHRFEKTLLASTAKTSIQGLWKGE